jgi:hypothetical protein
VECNQRRKDEGLYPHERSVTRFARTYIKGSEARPNVDPIPGNTPDEPAKDRMTSSIQHETNTPKQKKPH